MVLKELASPVFELPKGMISIAYTNQLTHQLLPNPLETYAVYAPGTKKGDTELARSPSMNRGVIYSQTDQPYSVTFEGRQLPMWGVFGKGTGLDKPTSRSYRIRNLIAMALAPAVYLSHRDPRPLGFLRLDSAKLDAETSTQMIREGGRVPVPLAVLKLDHEQFQEWVKTKRPFGGILFPTPRGQLKKLEQGEDRITGERDNAAILIRTGPLDRYNEIRNRKGRYSEKEVYKRGAKTYLYEIEEKGVTNFSNEYGLEAAFVAGLLPELRNLSQGEKIGHKERRAFALLESYFAGWNYGVLKRVSEKYHEGKLPLKFPRHNQDFIFGGFMCDFEDTTSGYSIDKIDIAVGRRVETILYTLFPATSTFAEILGISLKRKYKEFYEIATQGVKNSQRFSPVSKVS